MKKRCAWCGDDPLYIAYHDKEWGRPLRDDRALFELLVLEGAQAGLSWITILRKRENYRKAFDGFDPKKVARYDRRKVEALLRDLGIVRNRSKVEGAVASARVFHEIVAEHGSFARYLWSFVGGKPIRNRRASMGDVPAETEESRAMSRDLKRRGFKFCGPTICYAFMQAAGLVDDHVTECFRYRKPAGKASRP